MKITKIFVGVTALVIAAFDGFIMAKGGTEASISHYLITASYKYPIMTFMFGVICGHLFWRMRYTPYTKEISDSTREWGNIKEEEKKWNNTTKEYE
jgi:hypothetical protein